MIHSHFDDINKEYLLCDRVYNIDEETILSEKYRVSDNYYVYYSYYADGNIKWIKYILNNNYHNTNGPAIVEYGMNGYVISEEYYVNGKYHRENGPAYIDYDKNRNIGAKEYYIHGKRYNELEYFVTIGELKGGDINND